MEGKNPANILFSSAREQRLKRARGTQFDIEILGLIQKAIEQVASYCEREISYSAFARIARGDNDRRVQDRHLLFDFLQNIDQAIEPKLEQIRRFFHADGQTQVGERSDYANNLRSTRLHEITARRAFFDRSARCHILSDSGIQGRAMIASLEHARATAGT